MTDDDMRQTLAPLAADQWGDAEYAAFGVLLGIPGERVPRAGSGHALDPLKFDIIGLLARHPEMARAFLTFNGFLLRHGELSPRLRELAILRVAQTRRSAFFWGEHTRVALNSGVSEDDIARLAEGNEGFSGVDSLVLSATDELLAVGRVDDGTWERLVGALHTHAAMELIFVVGTYVMLAMAFHTWGLAPPAGSAELPEPPSRQDFSED
ncbi:carboxymuconolactone decarboxylase family protein [Mycobacterium intracellulare]|uniref:carboxymuconolactone decarboxylase family protein n=1 Tax=Mycobacterium intracellulare TaxID=1767 RepID=UPI0019166252|nr:carboxymuconolactone decarboxylase family protein [Mycobacterium intracellulare]MCA2355841.1 carboxymuconolactone decarboxylase family protein [Mycobacterium intracellulare]MCA2365911.1 carboxymuconolactone decarboxylase family protein [Mycobacterium intracellulare]UGU02016.1 carboxymuconolactone decarboxylase family protein [Mycobacterium intracellulare]